MIWATAGGITLGLSILGYQLFVWIKGVGALAAAMKDPLRAVGVLLPFVLGFCYGALGILTVGGAIGWIFDARLWVSNWLGDAAIVLGVGGRTGVSRSGSYLPLTQEGSWIMLVLTVCFFAARRFLKCGRDLRRGAWCGLCLGASSGVAGVVAVPLATAVNQLGFYAYTWAGYA